MSSRERRLAAREARARGLGPFLKRWTIPAIGGVTPIGLMVVNIAAFIDHHLNEFRWTISVLAFVSGMMLNSWALLSIYRIGRRRLPHRALFQEGNQEFALVGGMAVVIASAFLSALFCYQGLANERELPNQSTFWVGFLSILMPILLQALFRRALSGGGSGPRSPIPPPPPPPAGNP